MRIENFSLFRQRKVTKETRPKALNRPLETRSRTIADILSNCGDHIGASCLRVLEFRWARIACTAPIGWRSDWTLARTHRSGWRKDDNIWLNSYWKIDNYTFCYIIAMGATHTVGGCLLTWGGISYLLNFELRRWYYERYIFGHVPICNGSHNLRCSSAGLQKISIKKM